MSAIFIKLMTGGEGGKLLKLEDINIVLDCVNSQVKGIARRRRKMTNESAKRNEKIESL